MSDETKARRGYGFWVAAGVVLAPLLYALSVGPAAYLVERTDTGRVVADIAYRPLIWLHRNTPLRKPINAYITTCARAGASAREKR
jgi:hypothetical protein